MKILVVYRGKDENRRPYITEQINALAQKGMGIQYFEIEGSKVWSYFSNFSKFKKHIASFNPDIIHVHYGLSGLFANMQKRIPVITTFHGSDINFRKVRPFSRLAAKLSVHCIFVTKNLAQKTSIKSNYSIIPCGVDFDTFFPIKKSIAREQLKFKSNKKYVLFSASFDNAIKNSILAQKALAIFEQDMALIELKDYTRDEVNLLLSACDVALMTSLMEGSPQFIKEAMACNCPIVSTDVGSVREIFDETDGCFITSFDPEDVAEKIHLAIEFGKRTNGRDKISHLDNQIVAENIITVYKKVIEK